MAPVNAPRRCPNRWLSSISRGTAEHTSTPKLLPARGEASCTSRAMISLPEPVSPVMSTGRSDGADPARHRVDLAHPRGNEHVALEHEAFFDRPKRRAMALFALLPRQPN